MPQLPKTAALAAAVCSLLSLPCAHSAAQALGISPVTVTLSAADKSSVFTVTNKAATPSNLQVRVFSWTEGETDEKLLDTQDALMSPPLTTIGPGQSQVLRFFLRKPATAGQEVTYRVIFDQLPGSKSSGQVQMLLRLNIPVFVESSPKLSAAVTFSLQRSGDKLFLIGTNKGGRHDKLEDVVLTTPDGRQFAMDGSVMPYILAGVTRRWPLKTTGALPEVGASLHLRGKGDGHNLDQDLAVQAGN